MLLRLSARNPPSAKLHQIARCGGWGGSNAHHLLAGGRIGDFDAFQKDFMAMFSVHEHLF